MANKQIVRNSQRELYLNRLVVTGHTGPEGLMAKDINFDEIDDRGFYQYNPRYVDNMQVLSTCFTPRNRIGGIELSFNEWLSLGKPRKISENKQIVYKPVVK